ncbi:MAG: hypothetical protein NTV94_11450 [Planctomycetota bacterium]|nr:hypothetical protein [Planctomycetota bacterium]
MVWQGVVTPSQPKARTQAYVNAAANDLEEAGIFVSDVVMCKGVDCRPALLK